MKEQFYILSVKYGKKYFQGYPLTKLDFGTLAREGMKNFEGTLKIEIAEGGTKIDSFIQRTTSSFGLLTSTNRVQNSTEGTMVGQTRKWQPKQIIHYDHPLGGVWVELMDMHHPILQVERF